MSTQKQLKAGQLAEFREHDPYTGSIVARHRVRLLELLPDDTWYVYHVSLRCSGGGWTANELYPVS